MPHSASCKPVAAPGKRLGQRVWADTSGKVAAARARLLESEAGEGRQQVEKEEKDGRDTVALLHKQSPAAVQTVSSGPPLYSLFGSVLDTADDSQQIDGFVDSNQLRDQMCSPSAAALSAEDFQSPAVVRTHSPSAGASPGCPYGDAAVAALVDDDSPSSRAADESGEVAGLLALVARLKCGADDGPDMPFPTGDAVGDHSEPAPHVWSPEPVLRVQRQPAQPPPPPPPPILAVSVTDAGPESASLSGVYSLQSGLIRGMPAWVAETPGSNACIYSDACNRWAIGDLSDPDVHSATQHHRSMLPHTLPPLWVCRSSPSARVTVSPLSPDALAPANGALGQGAPSKPTFCLVPVNSSHGSSQQQQGVVTFTAPLPPAATPLIAQSGAVPVASQLGLNRDAEPFVPTDAFVPAGHGLPWAVPLQQPQPQPQPQQRTSTGRWPAPASAPADAGAAAAAAAGRRRRAPPPGAPENWWTQLCRTVERGEKCQFGDRCHFAHNQDELRPKFADHAAHAAAQQLQPDAAYAQQRVAVAAPPARVRPPPAAPPPGPVWLR
eukprot:TRINITY_DN8405_c0_g1_i1.p1 TRINITY_DN8405_c0_g1~~TRINITY_DN8405_c0_g1_i1.p1  ORF type:complete len:592 (+),score=128.53 TRINITY_DN8405_c0_g1_i1:123-1778(+)